MTHYYSVQRLVPTNVVFDKSVSNCALYMELVDITFAKVPS
jgi:hypothetical protein